MAVIKSGSTSDQWTIDGPSKAGRATLYDAAGNAVGTSLAGLNRALNTAGFLRDSQFNYNANVGVFGDQLVTQKIWLSGAQPSAVLDLQQWTTTLAGSGTVATATGAFVLNTGITANSSALLRSTARAPVLTGTNNIWYCGLQLFDTGTINNEKRWGIGNAADGIDFSLQGSSMSFITRVNGVETRSNLWTTAAPVIDLNPHIYSITWAQGGYTMLQDGNLLTQVFAGAIFTNPHFQMTLSNTNTGGAVAPVSMTCVGQACYRLGAADDGLKFVNLSTLATTVAKQGPGKLESIVVGTPGVGANVITIYDNNSAVAPIIAVCSGTAIAGSSFDFKGLNFFTGLTIAITGGTAAANITVIYQ